MKIGISGPVNIDKFCKILNLDKDKYLEKIKEFVSDLAKSDNEIVIVPHKNSTAHIIAQEYKKNNGKKIISIIPKEDDEFGLSWMDLDIHDELVNSKTWRNVPEELDTTSDILIAFGLGAGTLVEIGQTKWFKVDKIYIVKDFISQKLPSESVRDLNVKYLSLDEIKKNIFK